MSALIRRARPGDAAGLARVHVDSWRETYRGGLLPARYLARMDASRLADRWWRRLAQPVGDRWVWVLERKGVVGGFVESGPCLDDHGLAGFAGEVTMLYLHPDLIGRGLGGALFEHALERLERRPFYWAVVWVLEANVRARGFYERCGFRADGGRRFDRFVGREVPVIRLAKPLNPAIDYEGLLGRGRASVRR